jgi:hypothetical protein
LAIQPSKAKTYFTHDNSKTWRVRTPFGVSKILYSFYVQNYFKLFR